MAINEYINPDWHGETNAEQCIIESLLRTEIGFWRELIVSSRETETPDSIERMQHALELAEVRLGKLCEKPPSNVFHIDSARGEAK